MKQFWLRVICLFWLLLVTPIGGVFPLLMQFGFDLGQMKFIELAIIRSVWGLFKADDASDVMDAGPQMNRFQLYSMIIIAFVGAAVAIGILRKRRAANAP